jgi:hypothetical protein
MHYRATKIFGICLETVWCGHSSPAYRGGSLLATRGKTVAIGLSGFDSHPSYQLFCHKGVIMYKKKFYITEINRKNGTKKEIAANTYNDLMTEATKVIAGLVGNDGKMFNIKIKLDNSFEYNGVNKTEVVRMIIED